MDISEYLKTIYERDEPSAKNKRHKLKNINGISQIEFTVALFFNAGCTEYNSEDDTEYGNDATPKSIYHGHRAISKEFRKTFPKQIDIAKLSSFFDRVVKGETSLKAIMRNFKIEIEDDIQPNKERFFEALGLQFQLILDETPNHVDNIIGREYQRLIQNDRIIRFVSQEKHDNLMSDLENMVGVIPILKILLILLKKYDFSDKILPVFVIERLDESAANINSVNLNNQELSNAKKEYLSNQAAYCKYLLKITEIVPNTYFRKMHRFPLVGEVNIRGSEYIINEVEKLRTALISSIEKIIELERELKDNIAP